MGRRGEMPFWQLTVWLAFALAAMFAVVLTVIAASRFLPWVVLAGALLAVSAYCCAKLFMRLFYGR